MLVYLTRRLLWTPIVLFAVSFVTFTLGFYGPGDPVQVLMGQKNDPAVVERIRRERGLDKPFTEQYLNYITGVVTRFDFGESYKYVGQNVGDLIRPRIWNSVQLGLFGLSIGVLVGTAPAPVQAPRQRSRRSLPDTSGSPSMRTCDRRPPFSDSSRGSKLATAVRTKMLASPSCARMPDSTCNRRG